MSEISPNPLANEMNSFKEEILRSIREFETKLISKIEDKESVLNSDYQSFIQKINTLMNNNKDMISTLITQQLKLEKISELETFKNKVDNMLITHEIRIKNSLDEIDKIKTRYDKIISDNLYISGFIGASCQFRNLAEYINYNISEVSRLKVEKEQLKKDIKDIKNKFEGVMKSMINMNDNTVKLCNTYADSKKVQFEKLLENTQFELNQKSVDMRVMTQKFQNDIDLRINEITETVNKVVESEKIMNNNINDNFYICDKQHEEIKTSIKNENDLINNNKKTLGNLDEKIQNLQNKMKLIDVLNSKISKLFDSIKDLKDSSKSSAFNKNNIPLSKSTIQSPSPKKIRRKGSNPDLLKLDNENTGIKNIINNIDNNIPKKTPKLLQKSVRFPLVPRINLNTVNTGSSLDDLNKSKTKRKEEKNQSNKNINNIAKNLSNLINEKSKTNINESLKEKEKKNEKVIKIVKEPEKDKENEILKEIEKEKEIVKPSILKNANITNAIQTLPMIAIEGKRNSRFIILKPMEIENSNIINTRNNNNNFVIINSNNSQTQTSPNLEKMKKVGLEVTKENKDCKIVSLKLSPYSDKNSNEGFSKSKRPPKAKYNIVNSLINDYKAKLLSKMHSPDQINEMNNEILEIPKKVTQAFGRTAYTFYFNKDNSGINVKKKRKISINLKSGLKIENDNKTKK